MPPIPGVHPSYHGPSQGGPWADADRPEWAYTPTGRLVDVSADKWERQYALFTHLSLLAVHVLVPVVPALIMWLIKRKESGFVDDHGRETVNFHISLVVYTLIAFPVTLILSFPTCGLAFLLYPAIYVLGIVGMIMGAIAANKGEYYRYPASLRFV